MDENASMESRFTEADESAFDSGWDDESVGGNYAETVEDESTGDQESTEAKDETEGGEDQPAAEETEAEAETATPEQSDSFELNYMGQKSTVGRNEVVTLAQKGMDYDRIRKERDDMSSELETLRADKGKLTEYENFLDKLARSAGIDIPTLIDNTLAKALVAEEAAKGNTITEAFALEKIRFDREKADFEQQKTKGEKEKKPAAEAKASPEDEAAEAEKARRNDEANAFLKAYPDVDPKSIPKEVMDKWMAGEPLLNAYMAYENKKLKADLEAEKQNNKNRERSTGSAKSAGAGKTKDAFDIGWDSV